MAGGIRTPDGRVTQPVKARSADADHVVLNAMVRWKDHDTLLTCYQHPDDESLLAVMSEPGKLRERVTEG